MDKILEEIDELFPPEPTIQDSLQIGKENDHYIHRVQKMGYGMGVYLPKEYCETLNIHPKSYVSIKMDSFGKIIIKPVHQTL